MSLLDKINAMKMPFAELKGVKFTEADKDRVVAKMVVRPELCTLNHTIHEVSGRCEQGAHYGRTDLICNAAVFSAKWCST